MNTQDNDWKEARDYSFQMLQLLINASTDSEALKHLENDIDTLNKNYSSNVYLAGMQYTVEDIGIFRIGEDSERDKKLSELFTHILDLVKDNEESLIPPIEIFDPMKDSDNINDFKVSEDLSTIENKNKNTNEGESTMNSNTNTNNQSNQESFEQKYRKNTEVLYVVEKPSTWCKVLGGLTVTAAIGAGAYYAYKKFFKNEEA